MRMRSVRCSDRNKRRHSIDFRHFRRGDYDTGNNLARERLLVSKQAMYKSDVKRSLNNVEA
jgi:hypothetical protein